MRPRTPAQWKIPYEVSAEPMEGLVTGMGGVAVASRAFRGMKLPGLFDANLASLRRIAAGYTPGQVAETVVVAVMLGADCVEDVDRLRDDPAVEKMLGYKPASGRAVRDWLEKFHDAQAVTRARQEAEELDLKSSVPQATVGLRGLQAVLGASARAAAERQAGGVPTVATVDMDATVVESWKRAAQWTYTGVKGYQPEVAVWAEAGAVLATEFRDGNVPAAKDPLGCVKAAFAELPATVTTWAFRADSACDEGDLLAWLDNDRRQGGPHTRIAYAVSARMCPELAAAAPPSQKFGANAAWFALNAVVYNVMAALRAAAPDPELRVARVKRLRYCLLLAGARLTRFSRKITLRFAASREWVAMIRRLLAAFPCRVQPTG